MDRVSLRQFMYIVFLLSLVSKVFMLPTYMLRTVEHESITVMVIYALIDLLLIGIIFMIMRAGKGNLFQTLTAAFGKIAARIVSGILALFFGVKLFLMLTEFRAFFSVSVLTLPLTIWHIAPLLIMLIFFMGKRLYAIGRTAEIVTPLVIISAVLILVFTVGSIDFTNVLPVLQSGGLIGKGVLQYPMWFGDFILLLTFCGKTDQRKRLYFAFIPAVIGMTLTLIFSAMLYALYSNIPEILTYGHNISNMTQYGVSSFKFGRFDLLFFCMWLLGILLSAGLIATFVSRCVDFAAGKNISLYYGVLYSFAALIMMEVTDEASSVAKFMIDYFYMPAHIVQYGLPIVLLITLKAKKLLQKYKKQPLALEGKMIK